MNKRRWTDAVADAFAAGRRSVGEGAPGPSDRQRGVALILALAAIAILSIFSLEFTYTSRVAVKTSNYVEAEIEAHLHARAAVELAALVIGSNDIVESLIGKFAGMMGGKKPQINIGAYACEFVNAFCKGEMSMMGISLVDLKRNPGASLAHGTCGCTSTDDDGRVNVNRVNSLGEKQAVFDTLYKVLQRNDGETQFGELDKEMAQLALNIIDWADADQRKTDIDPTSRKLLESQGAEGAAYARRGGKIKDAPFDTTEEVRMVDGVTDAIWCKLRKQLTVYHTEKLNVNTANIEVIKALICKNLANPLFEKNICGLGFEKSTLVPVDVIGQYIEVCRTLKKMMFSPPFATPQAFLQFFPKVATALGPLGAQQLQINPQRMLDDIGTTGKIVRIEAYGTSGKVQKKITALLDTTTQKYVYWNED